MKLFAFQNGDGLAIVRAESAEDALSLLLRYYGPGQFPFNVVDVEELTTEGSAKVITTLNRE